MENEVQIKTIIAGFINQEADSITESTVIDRSAMKSSIHVHRMYAALADAGVKVGNPAAIRTFGDLQRATGMASGNPTRPDAINIPHNTHAEGFAVGIDIEDLVNFAAAADYREDAFYQQNFSPAEIAWCILQPSPQESFGGKFAAKEAIVKADNDYREIPFNRIEILNLPDGRPQFEGFEISISHTSTTAVAVAIGLHGDLFRTKDSVIQTSAPNCWLWLVALAALLLALVALLK